MTPVLFGLADAGCYAEGGYGHSHVRERLAELYRALPSAHGDVSEALEAEASSDAWEESAAVDELGLYCDSDVYWTLAEGDLVLMAVEPLDRAVEDDAWFIGTGGRVERQLPPGWYVLTPIGEVGPYKGRADAERASEAGGYPLVRAR